MTKTKRLLFALPPYERWRPFTNTSLGTFFIHQFPNEEIQIQLNCEVQGAICYVVGGLSPIEKNLLPFLALSHTLKKEGAKKVIAYIPYLAYARQDRNEPGKSQIAALIGRLLQASGIDQVLTLDVHSSLIHQLFPIPIKSLSSAPLFIHALAKIKPPLTIVTPDKGAKQRGKALARLLPVPTKIVSFTKTRDVKGVIHQKLTEKIDETALIIDDMLDTGSTLISCCQQLQKRGTTNIIILITHPLFTGAKWEKLWKLGVKKIYCTDTLPLVQSLQKEKRIVVIPTGTYIWKN